MLITMRVRARTFAALARVAQPGEASPPTFRPSHSRLLAALAVVHGWRERRDSLIRATWERRLVGMSDAELASLDRRTPPSPEDVRWRLVNSVGGGRRL
jgi:hypothetical protein